MRKTIRPQDVKLGMYVHGFEGSWFDHPFWRAGFEVETEEKLRKIRDSAIEGVIVEWIPESDEPQHRPHASPLPNGATARMRLAVQAAAFRPMLDEKRESPEMQHARAVMRLARSTVMHVFGEARLGRAIRIDEVANVVDEVSEAVLRNPDAMLKVARLKARNEYTYMHSVAVCTLMINFARTLNLPPSSYRALGLAGLLHDVGKLAIDDDILDKPGSLSPAEFEHIKQHTVRGRDLLVASTDVPDEAIDVCLHHHERMNGTGYPFGRSGDEISLAARMGAICDIYDALTSKRPYKSGWTPIEALQAMVSWEGHLDPALLFQFMRSIGIYVPGTLVELRSRQLGVILSPVRAGSARARAFFCLRARNFVPPVLVELGESLRHDQPLREADPGQHGLDDWEEIKPFILAGGDPAKLVNPAQRQQSA